MEADEVLHQGKWLQMKAKHATNGEHQVRWEYVQCTGAYPEGRSVIVLPITEHTNEVILIANYRYPVNQFVIELPAGFIDSGEDEVSAAIREVKEETGYTIRPEDVIGQSPFVFPAPWLTTESCSIFTVRVDLTLPENQSPQQSLDESELIKVIRLPRTTLLSSLLSYADQEHYAIDARLYMLAQGLELSSALS
jgi:ADP-ribose pyrophosphatase